jgi:glutaredoxin 3
VKLNGGEILSTGVDSKDFIEMFIHDHDVMVFAKSYCPHCKSSQTIIETIKKESSSSTWNSRILSLDHMDQDGSMIQSSLLERTGQRTVPNIFIGGKHIGGNSDLVTLYKSGELLKMLSEIESSNV